MLNWTLAFLVVALIAALLGFAGLAGLAANIAKILFVIFLVLFLVSLINGPPPGRLNGQPNERLLQVELLPFAVECGLINA